MAPMGTEEDEELLVLAVVESTAGWAAGGEGAGDDEVEGDGTGGRAEGEGGGDTTGEGEVGGDVVDSPAGQEGQGRRRSKMAAC